MTTLYFKATRPDGTDFHTGSVNYAAALEDGRPVEISRAKRRESPALCTDTVLHAADIPEATLVGGWWPCRLFAVTGRPVVGPEGHKRGFRRLRVIEELPAWQALGPQGEHVVAFVDRNKRITHEDNRRLRAAWDAVRHPAWGNARDIILDVMQNAGRSVAYSAAWNASWQAAWKAMWDAEGRSDPWDELGDLEHAVRNVTSSAVFALVVRDLIPTDAYDTLTVPWRQSIGRIHPDDPEVGE